MRRGDKVAIWLPNLGEWSLIWLAAASIGAAAVPVNTRYKANEAGYVIGQSDSVALFYTPQFLGNDFRKLIEQMAETAPRHGELSSAALPALRHVVAVTDDPGPDELTYRGLLDPPDGPDAELEAARAAVRPTDDLVYTSGTTGFPQGRTARTHHIVRRRRDGRGDGGAGRRPDPRAHAVLPRRRSFHVHRHRARPCLVDLGRWDS